MPNTEQTTIALLHEPGMVRSMLCRTIKEREDYSLIRGS